MDLRYALRMLARTPGFTLMAVATLAIGIGITTVVFTFYNAVALKPLPVRSPDEIVRLQWRTTDQPSDEFSWPEYQKLASAASLRETVATSTPETLVCLLPAPARGTEVAQVRFVSNNYFDALGVTLPMGRAFDSHDREAAILSHDFWTGKLHSDPNVFGKTLQIQGVSLVVLGVAPENFSGTGVPARVPDLWISALAQPLVAPGSDWLRDDQAREWQILGRRKPGAAPEQVSAELAVLSAAWPLHENQPVHLSALRATFFQTDSGEFRGFTVICLILMVAVGMILLLAAVNLVNLVIARNSGRAHELGIRTALGATRLRLLRQLCTESLVLGVFGGVTGLLVSSFACKWIAVRIISLVQSVLGNSIGVSLDLSPDWHVWLWTLTISLLTGTAVSVFPAISVLRRDVSASLKQGASDRGTPRSAGWRSLLLSAQIATCLVLLTAAGLLFRGAARSATTDPGFNVKQLAVTAIDTRTARTTGTLTQAAVERIRRIPAITSVAWADRVPFLGHGSTDFHNENGGRLECVFNGVSETYFETLGIPLLSGRIFTRLETEQAAPVAVISESTSRRLWPGQNPLGRVVAALAGDWMTRIAGHSQFTVVGVVKSVRSTYLSKDDSGFIYFPRPLNDRFALLVLRTRSTPEEVSKAVPGALAALDPNLSAGATVLSLEKGPLRLSQLMAEVPAVAASVLGGLALLLASLGVFGVISRLVAMRTREIGIRIAMGATSRDVIRMVGRQTLWPLAWGTLAGLVGAVGVSALLHALVVMPDAPDLTYGAGAFDPVTFSAVLMMLAIVVSLATLVPARRATLVEPLVALRNE